MKKVLVLHYSQSGQLTEILDRVCGTLVGEGVVLFHYRIRLFLVDLMCTLFCGLFAWKSWALFHEAWVEQQTTSSSWAPPLWIPYGLMFAGMTLLALQLAVQLVAKANAVAKGGRR